MGGGLAAIVPATARIPVGAGVGFAGGAVSSRLWLSLHRVRWTAGAPLATLGELIEVRDGVSPGYAARVALVARALAGSSGCSPRGVERIARVASLHTMGATASDPALLTLPTPLPLDQERGVTRHAVIDGEVLGASVVARGLVPVVRHHQEQWHGAGDPDGLTGEQIPLGVRIVAVADTAVALRSTPPTGTPTKIDAVLAILRDGASRQ